MTYLKTLYIVQRLALYTTVNYDGQLSRNKLKTIISRVPLLDTPRTEVTGIPDSARQLAR
ncbi:MAG TPA: hypothetical protein DCZ88_04495 [Pseudanabaena sp.]|nr:hypothetical protein [Pseudanabaena sp.]